MAFERMNIRLPADLKARLRERAETQRRTMNGEIITLLERAVVAAAKEVV
jgi:plasmid stability protein